MQRPKVIFLDAVGTLFAVRGSVGEVYSKIAQLHGVEVPAYAINEAFSQSFLAAPPPVFPATEREKLQNWEYQWWQDVAQSTFQSAGVLQQFPDFSTYFAQLYSYFATAEPWFIYPDVGRNLERWQKLGIQLGVLSNFDSRLYCVLRALDLAQFFMSVTISTEVGAAKPNPKIFAVALEKHKCSPQLALHIGDSFKEDYQGAKAAGMRAAWLKRRSVR